MSTTSYTVQDWVNGEGTLATVTINDGQWSVEAEPALSKQDAENLLLPALVDLHAVIQTPELTDEQMLRQGSIALDNGIAAVLAMPGRNLNHQYQWRRFSNSTEQQSSDRAKARVYQCLPLTRTENDNRVPLAYNAIDTNRVRALLISDQDLLETKSLLRSLQLAQTADLKVMIEPNWMPLAQQGQVHQGATAAQKGLDGVSAATETIALQLVLELIRETGTSLHITGISSARSVEIISEAKKEGLDITADTPIMNLIHTDEKLSDFDSNYKLWPPLRSREDQHELIHGIKNRTIDAITSYHSACASKHLPFGSASFGRTTFDNYIAMLFQLMDDTKIDIATLTRACCSNPARILGVTSQQRIILNRTQAAKPIEIC